MPNFEVGPLKQKLSSLHTEPQVERAVLRKEQKEGKMEKRTPEAKIDAYLKRLEAVFQHPDPKKRKRNVELFKPILHEELVISKENFPNSYIELQKKIAKEQGHGDVEVTEEMREKMVREIQKDQVARLDEWIDYLTSEDAGYPTWFKYLVFRSITKLSQFDKEKGHFKNRSKDTTSTYPDIYREALAIVADKLENLAKVDPKKLKDFDKRRQEAEEKGEAFELSEEEKKWPFRTYAEFLKYSQEKFPALYAEAIQSTLESSLEGREITRGEWVTYKRNDSDDLNRLYSSLQGQGTGWCTAGKSTAQTQLQSGDFHVYYTYKEEADALPTKPRIAIRMNGDEISEVRGVLPHQNIEPILEEIAEQKLDEFGSRADKFKKKSADMKRMTELMKKQEENVEFSKDDIRFLYEFDTSIQGFGYGRDPRIDDLREGRDWKEDMTSYFGVMNRETAYTLIKLKQGSEVISNSQYFEGLKLDQELALYLIRQEEWEALTDNLEKFEGLNAEELALTFLENTSIKSSVNLLGVLTQLREGFTQKVFDKAFDKLDLKHVGYEFKRSFERRLPTLSFSEAQIHELQKVWPNDIVGKLLEIEGGIKLIGKDSQEIENIEEILNTFFDSVDTKKLSENLVYRMSGMNPSTVFEGKLHKAFALKMIDMGYADEIVQSVDFFSYDGHQEILEALIEKGKLGSILHFSNLRRFHNINFSDLYLKAISYDRDARLSRRFNFPSVSSFQELDSRVAQYFLTRREYNKVGENLKHFKGLSDFIANKLIDNGYGKQVVEGLNSFSNLQPETLRRLEELTSA